MSPFTAIFHHLGALQVALAQIPVDPAAARRAVELELRAERLTQELLGQLQACSRATADPEIALALMATLREEVLVAELHANRRSTDAGA